MSAARFEVDEDPGVTFTLADFLEVNEDLDADDVAELEALPVGGEIVYGGGAAAEITLRRVE